MSVKERPIIFSGAMVKAILDGGKTQTRRVIKPQPPQNYNSKGFIIESTNPKNEGMFFWESQISPDYENFYLRCPYGNPGDLLYVRETFVVEHCFGVDPYDPPFDDGRPILRHKDNIFGEWWEQCHYRASDDPPELYYEDMEDPGCRWKPSRYMPKWAARIWLEITKIKVERVQDITGGECFAEGCPYTPAQLIETDVTVAGWFAELWDSINGKKESCGWADNPWVWVIEFKMSRC